MSKSVFRSLCWVVVVSAWVVPGLLEAQTADLIFHGGTVVTAAEPPGDFPEAVAVRGERILAVGTLSEVMKLRGERTRDVDLSGGALLPGFIDAHGHLTMQASVVAVANLAPPPAGGVEDIPSLLATLSRHGRERDLGPRDWVVGFGYDDSLLSERRHPTRDDLDSVFSENPVLLYHVSGHLATSNSRALELAGISAESKDPAGGVIRRRPGNREPNGVLEESAFGAVAALVPPPTPDEAIELLAKAQQLYAGYGLTTAQDGYTQPAGFGLLKAAAAQDQLLMDVVSYPAGRNVEDFGLEQADFGNYDNRLKVGGVKLSLDGSPQGKTAYLSKPYEVPPAGQEAGYRGYPAMEQDQVDALVAKFLASRTPMLVHCNGDAAADQLIHALRAAKASGIELGDHRTVMIHSQIVREEQLDELEELGVVPSFFVAHTFFWGDWHRDSVLGPKRGEFISPARSAGERGIRYTFHNDAPIVPPNVMRLIWAGVNRRTRSGDILGPLERVSVIDAIRAVTIEAAYQSFDEDEKGSIEVGKLADLVVLADDPLAVDPMAIKDIEVLETFSRGRSVFKHADE